ncbi:MAG: fructose-1,6-bisphosphatase [Bacillota bacterium]|nr:fructose-1,6-bisphosphatase [Bacillota bacterium]
MPAHFSSSGKTDLSLRYLKQLSKEYPSQKAAAARIVSLKTWMHLPKGTEYFFSDLHGEHKGFLRMLKSASGTIRDKIETLFTGSLSRKDRDELAQLIYEPEAVLRIRQQGQELNEEWYYLSITRLIKVFKAVSAKYTRYMTRGKIPPDFMGAIDELCYMDEDESRAQYHFGVIRAILDTGIAGAFISSLCAAIRKLCVARLHIIGDIYDRGAHPDLIMDELMNFGDVDVLWGNHDILWLGAALGNPALIANVMRQGIAYNTFDLFEDGYGLNLRPLSVFANEVYGGDPCQAFQMKGKYNVNIFDTVDPDLGARMHKAMAVIQFKLEGQLVRRRPEYGMAARDLLSAVDYEKGTVKINGVDHPLKDTHFPTIDPKDPLKLSQGEEELMRALTASFRHSGRLQKHMRFLLSHGALYLRYNGNLLYHGCVPMNSDGSFMRLDLGEKQGYEGVELFDRIDKFVRDAWFLEYDSEEQIKARDFLWYLWCGPISPIFGKNRMATFERALLGDKSTHKEHMNAYYSLVEEEEACRKILSEFSLDPDTGHIINGHVPVKIKQGESPVKGNGRLYMIDGGISKAYQGTTGIGGYTLIFNSHSLALAQHPAWDNLDDELFDSPVLQVVEKLPKRMLIKETDAGERMALEIKDLEDLIAAYRSGQLQENQSSDSVEVFDPDSELALSGKKSIDKKEGSA